MTQWFKDVWEGFWTVLVGMKITWRHMFTQPATLQYPSVKWPLPPKSCGRPSRKPAMPGRRTRPE